jgi:hypothetical protein
MHPFRLAGAAGLLLLCVTPAIGQECAAPLGAVNPTMQCGARGGADLRVEPDVAHPNACSFLCDGDNQCLSWTYRNAERTCHLKAQAPPVQNDICCFTGRKIN